jgi:RNA polymerase primary sigma factor
MKRIDVKLNSIVGEKKGILQTLLSEAAKYKPLTPEQEKIATKEQLINHNILFACSVAFRHYNKKIDIMDLVSESLIGLMKAAETYDSSKNVKFISYAVYNMRAQIMNFIDSKGDTIRVTFPIQMNKNKKEFENDMLSDKEISDILGISEYTVKQIRNPLKTVSIDESNSDGDNIYEVAGDYQTDEPLFKKTDKELVKKLMRVLNEREREIINLRYFDIFEHKRQTISQKYKITHEAVRLIEINALNKMRKQYVKITN